MRLALTDKAILALQLAAAGQQIVRDTELPGFFVMVGKRTKTFMVQGDLRQNGKRQSLRLKVGEVGEVRTREARAKAKALLGLIGRGVDPRPKEAGEAEAHNSKTSRPEGSPDSDLTLRAAWRGIVMLISSEKAEARKRSRIAAITLSA
jgi:hypothetical protein